MENVEFSVNYSKALKDYWKSNEGDIQFAQTKGVLELQKS